LQQYVVSAQASVEKSNLCWVQLNQKDLKADTYQGIHNAIAASTDANKQGYQFTSGKWHLSFFTLSHHNDFWLRHDKIKYFIIAFSVSFLLI
jgi:hypothetical protein